jgi:hypothetical protein
LLSFPRGTEMFQFPRFPSSGLCVQPGMTGHDPSRVSPFGDPRIKAWSTAPRGLSQPPTSFIGIWRQGIHRWLFLAWEFLLALFARCSCSLCSSQGTGRSLRQVRVGTQWGRRRLSTEELTGGRKRVLPHNGTVNVGRIGLRWCRSQVQLFRRGVEDERGRR